MNFTRDEVLNRIRQGEWLGRGLLNGFDLSNAGLEGAVLDRCDLEGANLEGAKVRGGVLRSANLREAFLVGADLRDANLEGADLEGAKLSGAKLSGANLSRASLAGADLESADLTGARLCFAQLEGANLGGADLSRAVLQHAELEQAYLGGVRAEDADFTDANLTAACLEDAQLARAVLLKSNLSKAELRNADFSEVDMRFSILLGARLEGTKLTGASVVGLVGTGAPVGHVVAEWVDGSPEGDGSELISNGNVRGLLAGKPKVEMPEAVVSTARRYLGAGDSLSGAALRFAPGAAIEVDSVLERCSIELGAGTELCIGEHGVLADCTITGPGSLIVRGKFYQGDPPGLVGLKKLVVHSKAVVVADVAQGTDPVRFAFERGCGVRMRIMQGRKK
jgi:uncharacterized protein YjbI with pentapeptide repeats